MEVIDEQYKGSAVEYYLSKYGVNLRNYDKDKANWVGSNFLSSIYYDKDELLDFLNS